MVEIKKIFRGDGRSLPEMIVSLYLLLMFGIFPLFCSNGFFNIRHDRYYLFLALSLAALIPVGGIALWNVIRAEDFHPRLSVADWGVLAFLAVCLISTLFSVSPKDALLGTLGRNNGLILMMVYVGVYFMISRYGRPGKLHFAVLAATCSFVSLVAILNFFTLDPLKMLEPLSRRDRWNFFSTIGNKNILCGYLCITVSVIIALFMEPPHRLFRWLMPIPVALGFTALMAADSDSGILGIGVFLLLCSIRYSRHIDRLKRFALILTVMLMSARLLGYLTLEVFPNHKSIGSFQQLLVLQPAGRLLCLTLGVLTAGLYVLDRRKPCLILPKVVPEVLCLVYLTGVLAAAFLVFYFTHLKPDVPLQGIWIHFRFCDTWGTNRGYIWRKCGDIFRDLPLWRKLIGSGPDTLYAMFRPFFRELAQFGDRSVNAAHNELLNYLITLGILGTGAYATTVVSSLVTAFRSIGKNPLIPVFCAAVLCYSAQATVSIALPITTPLFFLFVALCEGSRREI